ncbi:MAG: hypothetical protein ACE5HX_15365, partial [bacterium]
QKIKSSIYYNFSFTGVTVGTHPECTIPQIPLLRVCPVLTILPLISGLGFLLIPIHMKGVPDLASRRCPCPYPMTENG